MKSFRHRLYDLLSQVYFFLQHPSFKTETIFEWNGLLFYLRTGTSDYYVVNEILHQNTYRFEIPDDGIVLDIGANIGVFSLYAAQKAAKVIAYEPEASNFVQLTKHIDENHLQNITSVNKAIGAESGQTDLYVVGGNRGMSSMVNHYSDNVQTVTVLHINEVFHVHELHRVDLLKMDIEGGEYQIFRAISDKNLSVVQKITMEFHQVAGESVNEIISRLEHMGFIVKTHRSFMDKISGRGMLYASRTK